MPILIIFIYWSQFFGWSEDLHKLNCLVIARTRAMVLLISIANDQICFCHNHRGERRLEAGRSEVVAVLPLNGYKAAAGVVAAPPC